MSDIKLKAASGGGSISLKGPSSAGSDTDFLDTSGNLKVTGNATVDGTSTLTGNVTGGGDINCETGYYQTTSGTNRFSLTHDGANCYLENQIGSFYVKSVDNANPLEVSNNAVTLNNANLVIGTSGKGIDFSATSDASGKSSEVLDDYEEGTWVPDVKGYNSAGSTTYNSNRLGQYIKIGRQVTAWFYVGWTAQDGSGSLAITLPFTCSDTSAHQVAGSVFFDSIDTDGSAVNHALHTWHNVNVTLIYYSLDNGGWSGVSVDSAGSVIGTLTYLVA